MNILYSLAIAVLFACGIHLLLSRNLLRSVLGIALLSAATNLTIFFAGGLGATQPPVIALGEDSLREGAANPLPQALVLTAIVIGFALLAFACALVVRSYHTFGTLDGRKLHAAEMLGSPERRGNPNDA